MAFAFLADFSPPQSDGVTRQDSNMREIAEEEKKGYVVTKICVHESAENRVIVVGGGGGGGRVFLFPSDPFLQQVFHKIVNEDVTV
jgi:hypothetical protein